MLEEAQTLPQAAADAIDALLHVSLLAAASGYPEYGQLARRAVHELVTSAQAGCIVPAEYLTLEDPAPGDGGTGSGG